MFAEKTRVGILRGGPSSEYDISLKSGAEVLKHLPEKYHPIDIFIDRGGNWHTYGLKRVPHQALQYIDVIFNALHGEYGEDGKVQHLLETHGVPFSGSRRVASALSANKVLAKRLLARHGIKTPYYRIVGQEFAQDVSTLAAYLYRSFPQPSIIKPLSHGSSVGVALVRTLCEIEHALDEVFRHGSEALIEEYIEGKEASCGVIDDFRGEKYYALLPIEIILPPESQFFDYYAKYSGKSREICPGNFSRREKDALQEISKIAHALLGLRYYSRSDFIVHPRRGIYFLEVDSLPGLTSESLFPKALQAVGSDLSQFLDHVLQLAMTQN